MVDLTDASFDEALASGVTVVDFWSPGCGPCRIVEPALAELESLYMGQVTFARVNIDVHHKIALRYRVMSVPTVIYFVDGRPGDVAFMSQPKHVYKERLDRVLATAHPEIAQ
jgi:thioredoxin 1